MEQEKVLFCAECEQPFKIPVRRGRNPKFCESCREKIETQKTFRRENPSAPLDRECETCGKTFAAKKLGRGHAKICGDCRDSPVTRVSPSRIKGQLTSEEIVDRLENRLLANGSHISQHRHRWE